MFRIRVFVPGRPFQTSQMFVAKAWTYASKEPFMCSNLKYALSINYELKNCINISPQTGVLQGTDLGKHPSFFIFEINYHLKHVYNTSLRIHRYLRIHWHFCKLIWKCEHYWWNPLFNFLVTATSASLQWLGYFIKLVSTPNRWGHTNLARPAVCGTKDIVYFRKEYGQIFLMGFKF